VAKWVKMLGSGEVITQAGEDPDEPEYVVPLYLSTDYSPGEINTMPYWCEELLQSHGAPFFALATAVRMMDLTTSAEVEHYSTTVTTSGVPNLKPTDAPSSLKSRGRIKSSPASTTALKAGASTSEWPTFNSSETSSKSILSRP
jgi:hypothetical protein